MIELTVKTLDSRNHSFSVADDFTVKQLKEHIAETVGISAESQRLIYCGRVLQDEKKLNEYDVNGKVIHLVQRAPPSSNGSGGGGGGASGTSNTTTGQRRPWRNSGNAMYLGAMAFPAEIMDATGIAMQQPRHCLSHSRLTVVRMMLRRAESVLSRLENPSAESSPDNANGAAPPELSVEDDITNGNNPVASVEISTDAFEIRNPDAGEGSSEPLQEEARAPGSTPPESEPQSTNEGGEEANNGRQRRYPRPPMLAELMDRVTDVNIRLAPFMAQYRQLMLDDPALSDQAAVTYNQRLFNSVSEIMHNMSHAYHALSDIMCDFSQPPPRSLRCRPVLIHHSAVVHTGIPIQVSASLGAMPANQAGAGAGANSDTANSNGRPSDNSSPVDTETTAPSAPPPATGTNQPRTSPPVAHVAPRIGTVGGGGPGFEFLVDMTPGSITIDSVEAHVVTNSPPNSTDTPPNNWQNPPEFVQNLISALAGQFMGATLQQFQFPSQQNVGTNTQSTQQNTGTNTQTTGSTQTQTTATATQSTGTSTQNASVSTQNTGTSTQNTGISTQNTGTNTQNTGANANSQQPTANGGGGGAASRASGPTGGSQPQPQPQLQPQPQPQPQPRANGRPHVHLSPHGLISNHFDPFLPCNSHHIRGSRGRAGRPPNGSNAQAGTAAPPPPPRAMPIPSSISISLRADPVISVEAHPVRSSGTAPGNMQPVLPFPPELQAYLESLRAPVVTNDPAAALPQQIAHLMQAIQGSQGSQNPPTIAQMILNVPGYTYVAGESIVYDICMTLAQSLTMMDVIGLGLGQSACLGRAWPQLRQLITRLNGQTPRLVERLNAELHTHYSIFDNVRLREDVDLPASISRYNQRMLPDIINIIMDESQPATSFHRVLMRKCALYVHQLCALLQYCCVDASGFESLLRACVNRVTSGIPAALQEWTTASSMQNLRSFISSVNTPASEILQYVVFRATSPQPATAPAPAPASQPTSEPMDTHEAEEVRLELAPALNGEVPPVADDAPSAPGWQGALPSEWVPIITRDSQRQRRQNPQGPFSDAYLTGMPSKRRKLISSAKPQGNLSQVISEGMATALGAAGMSSGPEVEAVVQRAGQDSSLRAAYRDQVRSTLSHNLDVNPDFVPDKYPNTTKYFDKK